MTIQDRIHECLGPDAARYAANKHRGGTSGQKGTRYEDHFAVWKIVCAASALIDDPASADPTFASQLEGFVDDLRISLPESTDYFQLKNAETVSWTSGEHPLQIDFAHQVSLSRYLDEPAPRTHLVVSNPTLEDPLRDNMPVAIQPHSVVHHFPWCGTVNRLLLEHPELRPALLQLANIDDAPDDVLAGVFGALMMAFLEAEGPGAGLRSLFGKASRMFPGSPIRPLPASADWRSLLDPGFVNVLAGIEGLAYRADRGVFQWSGFGTKGVFGTDVASEDFRAFQAAVIESRPSTFDAFEAMLP